MDREDGIACSFSVLFRFNVDIHSVEAEEQVRFEFVFLNDSSSVYSCNKFQETEDSTDMDPSTESPEEMKCCLCDELFDTSEQSLQLPTGWQNAVCLDCRLRSLSDQTESNVKALS